MGLRAHKSIRLGKNTRLNLSKSGMGFSTGVKGFRVGVGPRGVKTTTSIPGTGISHTTQHSLKPKKRAASAKVPVTARPTDDGKVIVEVYGEKIKEQRADKPLKLTARDRKKGMRIAKKHMKAERRAARRTGCLGGFLAALVLVLLAVTATLL